ncbi:MAG: AAA family ATPase [Bacteroidota bacterium]|nr:AAA family ATPase [Bacteroidota bacterium]
MDNLFEFQDNLLRNINNDRRRFLHSKINWNERMIAIKGPRGAGKTTLMLQHLKFDLKQLTTALYVTADHTWFYKNTLLETAFEWSKQGGTTLFIDEVHKYQGWSTELKNIYDGLPQMKIIFSASSALDLYRGEADLSRRLISYSLPGLSFREYLYFAKNLKFNTFTFDQIRNDHREISTNIIREIKPIPIFNNYLKTGYLPFFLEGENSYLIKLEQIINTVVESDLAYIQSYNSGTSVKLKKLMGVIAESAPFKPNIAALARKLDLSRDSIYQYINQLAKARLINTINQKGKGVSTLQKPEKVFLENTNFSFALKSTPDLGNIRETFVLNQLLNANLKVDAPENGDFFVEDLIIEAGGKKRNQNRYKTLRII